MRVLICGVVVLWSVVAFADQSPRPSLSEITAINKMDAGRLMTDIGALLEAAKEFEGKALYWEDACRSTAECGGKSQ